MSERRGYRYFFGNAKGDGGFFASEKRESMTVFLGNWEGRPFVGCKSGGIWVIYG